MNYSPSRLHALSLCPKFANDESRDSSAADAGTRAHKAVELKNPEMLVDDDERNAVMKCLLVEHTLRSAYPQARALNEMKLQSSLNHGTGDLVLIDLEHRVAVIRDWKFGYVPVPPPEYNIQILNYAYNLLAMVPEIDRVSVGIVQPNVTDEFPEYWVTREMIPAIQKRFERIVAEAEDPVAQPRPNDNCQYCANKQRCKPWLDSTALALQENEGLAFPRNWDLLIDVGADELSRRRACVGVLEGLVDQLKKACNERAKVLEEQGMNIPGFSLVHKKGNLKTKDVLALYNMAIHDPKVDRERFVKDCLSISAKAVIELLVDTQGIDAADIEKELTSIGLVERGAGSTYLKKSSNKMQMKELTR